MAFQHDTHLARITPVSGPDANCVLSVVSLAANSIKLIAFHALNLSAVMVYLWFAHSSPQIASVAVVCWLVMLAVQTCLVMTYPEWPVNRSLCRQLRRSVSRRLDRPDWTGQRDTRVVELVPREHWGKSCFETATDLMLMRIDDNHLVMEGDRDRYSLPGESILAADLEEIRPAGWLAPMHMVVITARTDQGVRELPIAFRDHGWGNLRPSRRREQAIRFVNQLDQIASGSVFSDAYRIDSVETPSASINNPYAITPVVNV